MKRKKRKEERTIEEKENEKFQEDFKLTYT